MSAGITLAHTAIDMGKHATFLPEYGPEQRGGSAKCTVVVNDTEIISPLMAKCDTLIVMNEQAYAKFGKNLKSGGVMIANTSRVTSEITRDDVTVVRVPADDLAVEFESVARPTLIQIVRSGE